MTEFSEGQVRIAVVGGGISGLAAAEQLTSLDPALHITLFEANAELGGVLQTWTADGYCLELGPDSLLSRLPWGVDLLRRIGLGDQLISTSPDPQGVHVVCRGRLERVPEGLSVMSPQRIWPMVTTPILSWRGKLRLALERLIPPRHGEQDESLADFSCRRFGRETFERLIQPLAGGIYMGDPQQLSIRATFPQFVEMESKYGSLVKATRAMGRKNADSSSTGGGPEYSLFVAPRGGFRTAIDALASRLSHCQIHRHHRVLGIVPRDGGWTIEVKAGDSQTSRREDFAGVIVAGPSYCAGQLLRDADSELSRSLTEIPYAGCVVVNLAFDREAIRHPLDSYGFVVPHIEQLPVLACTFSSNKYAGRAPQGKVLLRAFLGGACFPEVMQWSDQEVLTSVQSTLARLLGTTAPPIFTRITRWDRAMPQSGLGHLQKVEQIEQRVKSLPGLELAGNGYRGVGIPHCVRSGQQASQRLFDSLKSSL